MPASTQHRPADVQPILSDAAILAEVETAMRVLGEGRGSIPATGERLLRRIIGLEHEMPVPAVDPWAQLNLPATDTGD
jgi:hypothetical protein